MVRLFEVRLDIFEWAVVFYLKIITQAELWLLGLTLGIENWGNKFLRNAHKILLDYWHHIPDDIGLHNENVDSNTLKAVYDVTGAGTTVLYTHKSDSCGSQHINDELRL
jgi:hypothetical protein